MDRIFSPHSRPTRGSDRTIFSVSCILRASFSRRIPFLASHSRRHAAPRQIRSDLEILAKTGVRTKVAGSPVIAEWRDAWFM
eukprot:2779206-Prymnesium_polylepis.1